MEPQHRRVGDKEPEVAEFFPEGGDVLGGLAAQLLAVGREGGGVLAACAFHKHQRHMGLPQPPCEGRGGQGQCGEAGGFQAALFLRPRQQHHQRNSAQHHKKHAAVFQDGQEAQHRQRRRQGALGLMAQRRSDGPHAGGEGGEHAVHPQFPVGHAQGRHIDAVAQHRRAGVPPLFAQRRKGQDGRQEQKALGKEHAAVGKADQIAHHLDPQRGGGGIVHEFHHRVRHVGQPPLGDHGLGGDGPVGQFIVVVDHTAPLQQQGGPCRRQKQRYGNADEGAQRLPFFPHKAGDGQYRARQIEGQLHRPDDVEQPRGVHHDPRAAHRHQRGDGGGQLRFAAQPQAPAAQPGEQGPGTQHQKHRMQPSLSSFCSKSKGGRGLPQRWPDPPFGPWRPVSNLILPRGLRSRCSRRTRRRTR